MIPIDFGIFKRLKPSRNHPFSSIFRGTSQRFNLSIFQSGWFNHIQPPVLWRPNPGHPSLPWSSRTLWMQLPGCLVMRESSKDGHQGWWIWLDRWDVSEPICRKTWCFCHQSLDFPVEPSSQSDDKTVHPSSRIVQELVKWIYSWFPIHLHSFTMFAMTGYVKNLHIVMSQMCVSKVLEDGLIPVSNMTLKAAGWIWSVWQPENLRARVHNPKCLNRASCQSWMAIEWEVNSPFFRHTSTHLN